VRAAPIAAAAALVVLSIVSSATGRASAATPDATRLVSHTPSGTAGNSFSELPDISADGRWAAFMSRASDLGSPGVSAFAREIYVYEVATGALERITVRVDGSDLGGGSFFPALSSDGRYVAFQTNGSFVPSGPFGGHIWVYDRQTRTPTLASVNGAGTPANSFSSWPRISGNGRVVAFWSLATNLVPGDTNGTFDLFVRDLDRGLTERVSVTTEGVQATSVQVAGGGLSANGDRIAFAASFPGQPGSVYVRDRTAGTTTRVASGGSASISADGRFVAYGDAAGLHVVEVATGLMRDVTVGLGGAAPNSFSSLPSISADGRYVAFWSDASNLVAGDSNGGGDFFVRDMVLSTTVRASVRADGSQASKAGGGWYPRIATTGDVVFQSDASDLVPGDGNGQNDVFLRSAGPRNTVPVVTLPPNATVNEGDPFLITGTFLDPDVGQTWTATVDYGDPSGIRALALAGFGFQLTHSYETAGTYRVTVSVTDSAGDTGTAYMDAFVKNAPPVVVMPSDQDAHIYAKIVQVGRFIDHGPVNSWTATVDYADGSGSQPLRLNADQSFLLEHRYTQLGAFRATVSVTDSRGAVGFGSTLFTVLPSRSFIFVHGIRGSWLEDDFPALMDPLAQAFDGPGDVDGLPQVKRFRYWQDAGDGDYRDVCFSPRMDFDPGAPDGGLPVDRSPRSIDLRICDSQSSVGISAMLLDKDVRRLHDKYKGQVTIIANSMGGAITRAFLAYSVDAHTGTTDLVDHMYFLQAVHEGSYLTYSKPAFQAATVAAELFADPPEGLADVVVGFAIHRLIEETVFDQVKEHSGWDVNSPAFDDLAPRSDTISWVNPPARHVPANIGYLNVLSDIGVYANVDVLGMKFKTRRVTVGDTVMLPGNADPRATPFLGGERFDAGLISPSIHSTEWILRRDVDLPAEAFRVLIRDAFKDRPLTVLLDPVVHAPESHLDLGSRLSEATFGGVPLSVLLLDRILFEGR
jgi:Tol biopolymer transport system component